MQAVLIPRLVRSVVARDHQDFRRGLLIVLAPTVAIGVLGMVAWLVAGPPLLHIVAGSEYDLPRADMALLALAVAMYLVCIVLQSAALALSEHVAMMYCWLVGGLVFGLLVALLPLTPTWRVAWAMVGAFAAAAGRARCRRAAGHGTTRPRGASPISHRRGRGSSLHLL